MSTEVDISLLTEPELTFLQNFAELTGRISNPTEETGISFSDNDWAKVSVTLTLPDTITAVAAEMEIFSNDFLISSLITLTGNKQRDMERIKYFCSSHAFESVHNAIMKINSFSAKRGQELIRSVRFPSSIEQRIWLSYFSEELNNNSDDNNAMLTVIFYEQKVWTQPVSYTHLDVYKRQQQDQADGKRHKNVIHLSRCREIPQKHRHVTAQGAQN